MKSNFSPFILGLILCCCAFTFGSGSEASDASVINDLWRIAHSIKSTIEFRGDIDLAVCEPATTSLTHDLTELVHKLDEIYTESSVNYDSSACDALINGLNSRLAELLNVIRAVSDSVFDFLQLQNTDEFGPFKILNSDMTFTNFLQVCSEINNGLDDLIITYDRIDKQFFTNFRINEVFHTIISAASMWKNRLWLMAKFDCLEKYDAYQQSCLSLTAKELEKFLLKIEKLKRIYIDKEKEKCRAVVDEILDVGISKVSDELNGEPEYFNDFFHKLSFDEDGMPQQHLGNLILNKNSLLYKIANIALNLQQFLMKCNII